MDKNKQTKPVIKIFVSHRIDQASETINNPLYVNVRCGAVYDKRAPKEYGDMLGDDTGDNISNLRSKFCELTVQYWAWKNQKADYYGLCHYRRYLSFSAEKYPEASGEHDIRCVKTPVISAEMIEKFGLSEENMRDIIPKYDLICMDPILLKNIKNNYEAMAKAPLWHNIDDVDRVLNIIDELFPEFHDAAYEYFFKSKNSYLYNCWVMKKELFEKFCEFQFKVLLELDKHIDYSHYSTQQYRACGVIGERLFGIFVLYLEKQNKYKILHTQIALIMHPEKQFSIMPAFSQNNIPLVVLSSDYYVPYLGVYLYSILKNSSCKNNYDIIVLEKAISNRHKKELSTIFAGHDNFSLRFYNPAYETAGINLFVADARYSEEAYYRMLVPWILRSYSKAIVTDCDMVMNDDIAKLYHQTNIDGYLAAGVKDVVYQGFLNGMLPDTMDYSKKQLHMKDPYQYVNTGVLLLNLDEWRFKYNETDIIELMQTKKFRIQEQDILNYLFEGKVKFLPIAWNYYTEVNQFIVDCIEAAPVAEKKNYFEAKKNPHLYHYASSPKPWQIPDMLHDNIWWDYARETIFYERIVWNMIQATSAGVMLGTLRHSFARRVADKLLPKGTKRREVLKKVMPRGSKQFEFLKRMYHKFTF